MKTFVIGVLKISSAIVIVIISLSLIAWGIYAVSEQYSRVANQVLAEPRVWPLITVAALENARITLSTVWREGSLSYQLGVDRYPAAARNVRSVQPTYATSTTPGFTITFLDKAGFKLFDFSIGLGDITQVVDDSGKPVGMSARSNTYVSADNYRQAASWEVTWNFGVQK